MSDLGKIINSHTVQFERLLPGPIESVWEHLTAPDGIATWLYADATMELKVGGRIDFKFDTPDPATNQLHNVRGLISAYEPPRLIAYSWLETSSDLTSNVRFQLDHSGDQVLLVVTHSRISPEFMPKVGAGWHSHLDVLGAILRGEQPEEFLPAYQNLLPKYSAAIASAIILSSTVSAAIASPTDDAYRAVKDQRQKLLTRYDSLWKESDELKNQVDLLKRTTSDSGRALDTLERELARKTDDLHGVELDIRDLDKALK